MDIRNDTSNKYFFAHLVRRPMTEVASILKFNICYIALASLLAEKRIYVKENMDTAKGDLVGMFDTLKYQSIKIT
ncbi:hypothetical protein SAMN04489724_1298 [Algoriphagus locisalis]|uniref:Uncharacterized protein n=1 Tax=Algoriphagus locisalis TaxID=305507 RepID=A0A1I6YXZ6_9BACT|nr:hypothetical protein SAMN04489724_1298 [Algoriphagus locisalis]